MLYPNPAENFIESIADYAICQLDADCNVISWNKGAQQILGYTSSEIIGKSFKMFFTPGDLTECVPEKMLEKIKASGSLNFEGWRMKKNEEQFWGDVLINALYDNDMDIIGYSVIARDITAKKKEREFEQSNMRALINNTHDLMWSVDRNYNLITANTAFDKLVLQLSGGSIEKGASVLAVGFTEEQLARFKSRYDRAFGGETFTEVEYSAQPYELWTEISFYPITDGTEIIGTACHSHNITKRVLAKRKITQLNRLYAFISQVNQAIVYSRTEQELFREICRVAIEVGNFKVSWIGKFSEDKKVIRLAEQYGFKERYLPVFAEIAYDEQGPTAYLLRTGNNYVCNKMSEAPSSRKWDALAADQGFW